MVAKLRIERRGMSVLVCVLAFAAFALVVAVAAGTLWRGSARTLFSVQERRMFTCLARSALAEAYYEEQRTLDVANPHTVDWFTKRIVVDKSWKPEVTRENAKLLSGEGGVLEYRVGDVQIRRVSSPTHGELSQGAQGLLDIFVNVEVNRSYPKHHARLTLSERRSFWMVEQAGPYGISGRHIELSPTPVGTWLEEK